MHITTAVLGQKCTHCTFTFHPWSVGQCTNS